MEGSELFTKELDLKEFTHKDAIRAIRVWTTIYNDHGGYVANDFDFHVWENGSITISDNEGDHFVSLDKEFVDVLVKLILEERSDKPLPEYTPAIAHSGEKIPY